MSPQPDQNVVAIPNILLDCCNTTPEIGATCVLDIEQGLPLVPGSTETIQSLSHLFLSSCILNAKSGSAVQVRVRNLPSAVDLCCSFVANPFFALLLRNSHETSLNAITNKTISTASDAVVSLFLMRKRAFQLKMTTWIETDRSAETNVHLYLPHVLIRGSVEGARPKVLIIEDNRQIGMLMELYLRQEEYDTMYAENGVQGLESVKIFQPDIVTLDVMMPQKDGWQVLRELKTQEGTADIPVVMVSVLKEIQSGFEFGASDYIIKPVERTALLQSVKRVLEQHTIPLPCALTGSREICIVSPTNALQSLVAAKVPEATITTIHPGDGKLYQSALNLPRLPDLLVADCRDLDKSMYYEILRIRLSDAFDSVPVLAIHERAEMDRLRFTRSVIFDDLIAIEDLA